MTAKPKPPMFNKLEPYWGNPATKKIPLIALRKGRASIHFCLNVTARSRKISEAKKLLTISAPCCAAAFVSGIWKPNLSQPAQIAATNENKMSGRI
ncbi:MAG TPA: hypothetical protein VMR70_20240 [Flavisolibacter sp.]|nr:hypothetical protein [Flavisolibacter sp.]